MVSNSSVYPPGEGNGPPYCYFFDGNKRYHTHSIYMRASFSTATETH